MAKLYADTHAGALGQAERLDFGYLEWGDMDAEAFAAVLPTLERVEWLYLVGNHIGTRGLDALADAIRAGAAPRLRTFEIAVQPSTEGRQTADAWMIDGDASASRPRVPM